MEPLPILRFTYGPFAENTYVVIGRSGREAMIVDPGMDAEPVLEEVAARGLTVTLLLNTHGHLDHVAGNAPSSAPRALPSRSTPRTCLSCGSCRGKRRCTASRRRLRPSRISSSPKVYPLTFDGDAFDVIHTPGHTPGGVCLRLRDQMIVGDTLFHGSVGRTDLPGGDWDTLVRSIRDKLFVLPDEVRCYPGTRGRDDDRTRAPRQPVRRRPSAPSRAMTTGAVVAVAAVVAAAGAWLGWFLNNRLGAQSVEAAKQKAEESLRGAHREADNVKRQAVVEAREQILKERTKAEGDLRSRRGQLVKREKELKQLRDSLTEIESEIARKQEALHETETDLASRETELTRGREELTHLRHEENARLERASGLTRDEARRQLLRNLRAEVRFEAAGMMKEIKDEAQKNADAEARKIVALAMERIASDLSVERSITHFALPQGGQMRGRIIGHEGKNIRAFEQVTGHQLLLDEAGESVQLSGFNPCGARSHAASSRCSSRTGTSIPAGSRS
jgi:glyoxylase-like metal-dependent hydrolase (beta-lactamase superfamily II)